MSEDCISHYENLPMQYTEIFLSCKNRKCNFSAEAVLTSTHNLGFGAKIRKVYPCKPQFFYIRVGFKGVFFARTCYPDAQFTLILEDDDQYNMKIDNQQLVIYLDALNRSRVWLSFMTYFITLFIRLTWIL